MEAKLFAEMQKNMDINTLKELEKEVRSKIIDELEILRNKNDDLSRILTTGECEMWGKIREENYSWLKLSLPKRKDFLGLLTFTGILVMSLVLLKIWEKKLRRSKNCRKKNKTIDVD